MNQSVPEHRWLRRLGVGLVVLAVLATAGTAYGLGRMYATAHAVASAVQKTQANVIGPNGLTVGDPFTVGLKPDWLYSQWLMVPTATPARKTLVLRLFLEQSLLGPHIKRIDIGCMQHDPKPGEEVKAYGLETTPAGLTVKDIPPDVLLGDHPVDLRRWLPGSFEPEEKEPRIE